MARAGGVDRGLFERRGSWWIRYFDGEGKEHKEKGGTKTEARALLELRRTEIRKGEFEARFVGRKKRRSQTVSQLVELYSAARLKQVSVKGRAEELRYQNLWKELWGSRALSDLTPGLIGGWVAESLGDSKKPGTVLRALNHLRALLNQACEDELLERNPVDKVKKPVANDERHRYLSHAEEARLKAVMLARHFDLVELALLTGLRKSEQFELKKEDVDLVNKRLRIPRSKSGKAREVRLNTRAVELLRAAMKSQPSEWVFGTMNNATGEWTHRRAELFLKKVFRPALEAAGIKNLHWHDLRHTFGSRTYAATKDVYVVKELLGHSSLRMTERYTHLMPGETQAAVDALLAASLANQVHSTSTEELTPTGGVSAQPVVAGRSQVKSGNRNQNRNQAKVAVRLVDFTTKKKPRRSEVSTLVEPHGFEPRTSSVQGRRSPS